MNITLSVPGHYRKHYWSFFFFLCKIIHYHFCILLWYSFSHDVVVCCHKPNYWLALLDCLSKISKFDLFSLYLTFHLKTLKMPWTRPLCPPLLFCCIWKLAIVCRLWHPVTMTHYGPWALLGSSYIQDHRLLMGHLFPYFVLSCSPFHHLFWKVVCSSGYQHW